MAKKKTEPVSRQLKLRNFKMRYLDQRVSEGGCFVRVHASCDPTPELIEFMKWDLYRDGRLISGVDSIKLSGSLMVEEICLEVNGVSGPPALECAATELDQFQLVCVEGEQEGVEVKQIRLRMKSTSWKLISEYFGQMGEKDGVLTIRLAPEQMTTDEASEDSRQQKLGETVEASGDTEASEDETESEKPETKSKDSRVVNGGRNLVSHRRGRGQRVSLEIGQ